MPLCRRTVLALAGVATVRGVAAAMREIPLAAAADAQQVPWDYARTSAAILHILSQRFGLPVPSGYVLELHSDKDGFEEALRAHLKLPAQSARTAVAFAKAAVGNRRVIVNEALLARDPWPEQVLTLAHELVHTTQLELAGQRSLVRYQWLAEGSAEWLAWEVASALGLPSDLTDRDKLLRRVRAVSARLAPLTQLDTLDQWIAARRERGFDAMYPYAGLAAELLARRHGLPALLSFFSRHRESADATAHFEAAFGETLPRFQVIVDRALAAR